MSEAKYIKITSILFVIITFFIMFLATHNITYSKSSFFNEAKQDTLIEEVNNLINYIQNRLDKTIDIDKKYIYLDCLNRLQKIKSFLNSKNHEITAKEEKSIRHKILCIINELKSMENLNTVDNSYMQI